MNLVLVDLNSDLCEALEDAFFDLPQVKIVNDRFENLKGYPSLCMVTAGNSFGVMGGGIDLAVKNFFGADIEKKVQGRINDKYFGEQPVGTSEIFYTHNHDIPWLSYTPTMSEPSNIAETNNVYYAMLSALIERQRFMENIATLAVPGLGTACGGVPFEKAAYQMALAYKNFYKYPKPTNNAEFFNFEGP